MPWSPPASDFGSSRISEGDLFDGLLKRGWAAEPAAAVVANAKAESSLDAGAVGDNGTSFGLFQWHGGRGEALKRYASSRGLDWADPNTQLDFLDGELKNNFPGLKDRIHGMSAPEAAAEWTRVFEVPAQVERRSAERASLASRILAQLNPIGTAQAAETGWTPPAADFKEGAWAPPASDFEQAWSPPEADFQTKPQADIRTPPVANATPGGLPIDPNAHATPESPPQGNTRMIRDLAIMQDVAGTMVPALPLGALGGKILGGIKGGLR